MHIRDGSNETQATLLNTVLATLHKFAGLGGIESYRATVQYSLAYTLTDMRVYRCTIDDTDQHAQLSNAP